MLLNLIAWLVGIALQLQQPQLWSHWAYIGLTVVSLLGLVWRGRCHERSRHWAKYARKCVCWAGLSFALTGIHAVAIDASVPALTGRHDVQIEGVISDWPTVGVDGVQVVMAVKAWRALPLLGDVLAPWTDGRGLVKLSWYHVVNDQPPKAGERWRLNVRLKAPHGYANPGGRDADLRHWRDRLWGVGYVRAWQGKEGTKISESPWRHWIGWRQAWREALWNSDARASSKPWLSALWVGDQSKLEQGDWHILRVTGTAHLVSVSGLHLTVWASIASVLVGLLWHIFAYIHPRWAMKFPRSWAVFIGTLLLAGGYAALAGWAVPVQRALCMLIGAMSLRLWAVEWPKSVVWLWVACWVLTWDPWAALQAGFWLSFVAVGVLFILPKANHLKWYVSALDGLKRQVQLSLALAPLSAWWFGQMSWVGIAANAIAIPWVSWCVLPLTLAGGLWSRCWVWAGEAIVWLQWLLAWWSSLPGAVWMVTPVPAALGLLALMGVVIGVQKWPWSHRALGVWMVLPSVLWRPSSPPFDHFELSALDVGQGTAVLVRTATHTLLFDAGRRYRSGGDVGKIVVIPALMAQGGQLDRLMLSHEDMDHIGGARSILEAYPEAQVWASFDWPRTANAPTSMRCIAGQRWVWDGVQFEVLHPARPLAKATGRAGNDRSCVLSVSAGGASALLTGDIGVRQEIELLARYPNLKADILVAAHHGSATSNGFTWMNHLRPRQVWVQAGFMNRYGHPAASVQARWAEMGQSWLSTVDCGALSWRSDTPSHTGCWRKDHAHYWSQRMP